MNQKHTIGLVHKSVAIRPEVWKKLRVNAELSGVSLRDFLTYIIEESTPVAATDEEAALRLGRVSHANLLAVVPR